MSYPNLLTRSSALKWVYRFNIWNVLWAVIAVTSVFVNDEKRRGGIYCLVRLSLITWMIVC